VKEWSKDAYECMNFRQHDFQMYYRQPRAMTSPTKPTGQDLFADYSVCCPEQRGPSQCPFPPSLSVPADCPSFSLQHSFSESEAALLPQVDKICWMMVKLLSCPRWIKLAAPVKWMAIMASSKKIRTAKGKAHV
jgi:hypothetical protein